MKILILRSLTIPTVLFILSTILIYIAITYTLLCKSRNPDLCAVCTAECKFAPKRRSCTLGTYLLWKFNIRLEYNARIRSPFLPQRLHAKGITTATTIVYSSKCGQVTYMYMYIYMYEENHRVTAVLCLPPHNDILLLYLPCAHHICLPTTYMNTVLHMVCVRLRYLYLTYTLF